MKRARRNSWLRNVSQGPLDNITEQRTKTLTTVRAVTTSSFMLTAPLDTPSKRASLYQKFVLHPESSFSFVWNILLIALIVYESFTIPIAIFLGVAVAGVLGNVELTITLVFLLDIGKPHVVLNFNVAVFDDGVFVTSHRAIAKDYLRHWCTAHRFWIDLLSSFPFPWLLGEFQSEPPDRSTCDFSLSTLSRLFRVARFLRILRLMRLAKLKKILIKVEDYIASTSLANALLLLRLLFSVSLLAHWTACLWYFVAACEMEDNPETWIRGPAASAQHNTLSLYLTALYFTFATMSTVGYGDVHPYTRNEKVFAIFTMVLACGVFAFTVGSINSLLTKTTAEENEYRSRVISVNRYMRKQSIPANTQFRVRRYLEYLWDNQKNSFLKEREILSMISGPLRDEIYSHVHGSFVTLCPVFDEFEPSVPSRLAKEINGETFAPGDVIFTQGEVSSKLYFIQSGRVNIFHLRTKSSFMVLSSNDYFGEIAFFLETARTASAECMEFADLLSVGRGDFVKLVEEHPASKEKLELIRRKCKGGDLSCLSVSCYICESLGHVAASCSRALLNFDKDPFKRKWLRQREKKSQLVNPHLEPLPNVERYRRKHSKGVHELRNVRGVARPPAELFASVPEMLRLTREYEESVLLEATLASRQSSYKPTEASVSRGRPRYSIFTQREDSEPVISVSHRKRSFRRSLLHRVPPAVEMELTKQGTDAALRKVDTEGFKLNSHMKESEEDLPSDIRPFLSFGESDEVSTTIKDTPGPVHRNFK